MFQIHRHMMTTFAMAYIYLKLIYIACWYGESHIIFTVVDKSHNVDMSVWIFMHRFSSDDFYRLNHKCGYYHRCDFYLNFHVDDQQKGCKNTTQKPSGSMILIVCYELRDCLLVNDNNNKKNCAENQTTLSRNLLDWCFNNTMNAIKKRKKNRLSFIK